jgi:hypothetical protein
MFLPKKIFKPWRDSNRLSSVPEKQDSFI